MKRTPLLLAAVALVGLLAAYLVSRTPVEGRPGAEPGAVEVVVADAAPPPPLPTPAPPPSAAPPSEAPPPAVEADAEPPEGDAAPPAGVGRYGLGRHTVRLRSPKEAPKALEVEVAVLAQGEATLREIRLRRRQLIRMVFFLGSHRQADGAAGAEGEARFKADLVERFRNVIRSGPIDDVELTGYRIIDVEPTEPDDGDIEAPQ